MQIVASIISNQVLPALRLGGEQTILYPLKALACAQDQERHDYWELCFLSEGKCSFYLAGKKILLEPNTLVLLPPGTPHREAWQESDPYELLWLGLRPENLFSIFVSRNFEITDGCRIQGVQNLIYRLEAAKAELSEQHSFRLDATFSHLSLFFIDILRGLEAEPVSKQSWQEQVVEAVQQYLAANFVQQITLEEISNQVGLSPNYLCALFRQATGETIFEQLAELRLERARFLLRTTQLPIYVIAEEVGYSSQFAFSRFFHKAMGSSPTSYREQKGGTSCAGN
jgi:AraC family transcriptional regulator of arabinose operon